MPCQCIEQVNEALLRRNSRLGVVVSRDGNTYPALILEKLTKAGDDPPVVLPTYCVFCGEPYEEPPSERSTDKEWMRDLDGRELVGAGPEDPHPLVAAMAREIAGRYEFADSEAYGLAVNLCMNIAEQGFQIIPNYKSGRASK